MRWKSLQHTHTYTLESEGVLFTMHKLYPRKPKNIVNKKQNNNNCFIETIQFDLIKTDKEHTTFQLTKSNSNKNKMR